MASQCFHISAIAGLNHILTASQVRAPRIYRSTRRGLLLLRDLARRVDPPQTIPARLLTYVADPAIATGTESAHSDRLLREGPAGADMPTALTAASTQTIIGTKETMA